MRSANLIYILVEAFRSIRENLVTTILTSVTLGFSLAIFSLFLFVFMNINSAIASWGDRTHIVAYVKDGAVSGSGGVEKLRDAILRIPGVKSAEFVSKEKALKELKDELKGHESVFEGVDVNPLPASFEIKVSDSYKNPAMVVTVVGRLKQLGWVEDIQFSQEWVKKVSAFLNFVELGALIIGVFLAAATLFIISNTIRLTVYARKDEIEIMRLVGASGAYIKVPFFLEGVLQGVLGGLLAIGILSAGYYSVASEIPAYFNFVVASPMPMPVLFAVLVAAGVSMGVAGSLISMARFLRV